MKQLEQVQRRKKQLQKASPFIHKNGIPNRVKENATEGERDASTFAVRQFHINKFIK